MGSYICCDSNRSEFRHIETLASIIKVVGEPNRLRLLCLLRQGEHCVCEILEHFDMSQSLISHHLADLREAGIVADSKKSRKVFYSLTQKGLDITNKLFSLKEDL